MEKNIIYKYRKYDKYALDILTKGELWFAYPKTLNDPFDCKIRFDFKMEKYKEFFREKFGYKSIIEQQPSFIDFLIEILYPTMPFRVLSLSKNPLNILMWSHYANSHEGFCIGLNTYRYDGVDYIKIEEGQINKNNKYNINNLLPLIPVTYSDDMPKPISDSEKGKDADIIKFLIQKSNLWKHEEEQRCILDKNVLLKPGSPIKINKNDIAEIIFGLKMTDKDKEKIIGIVSSYKVKPKVYQCKDIKGKY